MTYRINLKPELCAYCKREIKHYAHKVIITNDNKKISFCSEICLAGMTLSLDKENDSINKDVSTTIYSGALILLAFLLASILIHSRAYHCQ